MSPKSSLDAIGTILPSQIDLFICTASFESRCLSIATRVAARTNQAVIVRNSEFVASTETNFKTLQTFFSNRTHELLISSMSPTVTADAFSSAVISRMREIGAGNVLVDITTFTHEHLLILMALIRSHGLHCKIQLGYTGAAEYSTNTDEESVWLSRGVGQVRSILGYPGGMAPSKRLHLIILVGFEVERARSLIEILEPSKLSLGIGAEEKSVSPQHYTRNERFRNRLQEFLSRQAQTQTDVDTFTFSCIDPHEARDAVILQAAKFPEFNTVICPMNTKVSTIGVGLAALQEPRLQVVYATVAEYNEAGYSTPGEDVRIFSWV